MMISRFKYLNPMYGLTLIGLLMWLIALPVQSARPDRLMLTTQAWFPYQTYADGHMGGIATQRVTCVLRKMKQPYRITMTEWEEAQLQVKAGEQDGFYIATRTAARDKYATMSSPLVSHDWYLYFSDSTGDIKITPTNKLRWRVSAQFGTAKWYYLHKQGFRVIKKPRDTKTLIAMLLKNEVDAVLVDQQTINRGLQEAHLPLNRFRYQLLAHRQMGVYFRNSFLSQYPGFLSAFNQWVPGCVTENL